MFRVSVLLFLIQLIQNAHASYHRCPVALKFGTGPPLGCHPPNDPNNKPSSAIEKWFTRELFNDLFPKANLGWGPNSCYPYSYESFIFAARYFPRFGNDPGINYTAEQNSRRELAAFFAHAIQETGENDASLYTGRSKEEADDCFYRGGFYNWFEGGPVSSLLTSPTKGSRPEDGKECNGAGRYCQSSTELDYYFPCGNETFNVNSTIMFKQCYFGRGAIQLSYNFNYGQFNNWLRTQNIQADLLNNPNLLITHMNPPLAIMASIWFFMTPQPPKPSMHDIVIGNWKAGSINEAQNYSGAIFGPTSLIINNECHGEDKADPGNGGESRRIKAFKWFCRYFNVPTGDDRTLSCKSMPEHFSSMKCNLSYQPDWTTSWKAGAKCKCAPASYSGMIPFYDPQYFPSDFTKLNAENELFCQRTIYDHPTMYSMEPNTSACLKTPL